jgi:tetratricopeptide (TPR) repeat protein
VVVAAKVAEAAVTVIPVEEEIEEYDTYQFDPNSGPPAPPWQAWNSTERANLDEVTQALQERQAHFDFSYLLDPIRAFLNKGRSGYLLIEGESGVGKSYLGSYLESVAGQVHPRGIRIGFLKTARRPHGDYEIFIETVNDQLGISNAPRTHRILPLDRTAMHDLAAQFPNPRLPERWTAFVTSLSVHNRGPILLYLDEIDRRHSDEPTLVSPMDYLPDQLPDNVYVAITYKPDASKGFLEQLNRLTSTQVSRLTLEPVAAEYRKQLESELSKIGALQSQPLIRQALLQSNEFRQHYARLASQAWASGLVDETGHTKIADLYTTMVQKLRTQRPDRFASLQHFLMTLCAAFEPIAWDDLDQWGTSVETVQELVDLMPATLLQQKLGMFLCVDIAHESLRDFLINQNQEAFASVCRILTGWAVHTIQAAGELKLQSEQGREWARHSFYRLYRWSLLCQDVTVLEWVVRNKDLQKMRIAISQSLETSARPHQKLSLLDLWVEALRILAEEHQRQDLRDELAWALNSRGLTYLTLNRRQRALVDLDQSVKLFDVLVNQERQTQFRNGLAAAYNRRSEIHFALNQFEPALQDSTQAVQLFTDLVEDMGREDLQPLLAYAHRNQSSVWAASNNQLEATKSMEAAIKILAKLAESGEDQRYAKEQAGCHLQLAQQRQLSQQHQEALLESGKAVSLLSQISERDPSTDVRGLLERAHFVRGSSYLATEQPEKALRDFTKSITLSTQLVDEGRLDQRDELAQAYSVRSQTQIMARQPKEAARDLTKSIELRQKLLAEGRADQNLEIAQEHLRRAEVYRTDKQEEACQADLTAAQATLTGLKAEGVDVRDLLLKIFRQKSSLGMQLGRYQEVVQDADQALQLLQSDEQLNSEQEAELYALRGEGHRRLLLSEKARADVESCIRIYTELLQAQGDARYLVGLAEAYGNLARVSLTTNHLDRAQQEVNRSVEALEVAAKDNQAGDRRASLAQAYCTRAEVYERLGQHLVARQELTRSLSLYSKLVEAEGHQHLLDEQALAYRRLGRTLLSLGEPNPARDALEQATKRYKELWSKDRKGPWLDELSRTQVVNSAVSVVLKEYGAAEEEIQRSQEHFSGLLDQGKVEYFDDVFQTSMQRARNFIRVGMHAKATDELTRLFELLKRTAATYDRLDFREPLARVLQSKAGVYASQQSFEQAYNDFEQAIQTMQPLVVEESQFHLGKELAEIYRQRARMLLGANHVQPGLADLSQAAQVLSILLSQGREELRRPLAQVAQERATVYLGQNELVAAVEDLNLGVELLMSLASQNDPDLFAELAHMLSQRGRCFQQAQQLQLAAEDFEKAVQLYSRLVESEGRNDLSSILAECLLSHLSLSGQSVEDPVRLQALVKAVRLVTQQAKDGKPPEESFVVDAVTAVRNSLSLRPDQSNTELIESVIKLSEAILQVPRLTYNWVNLTELLSQCYQALENHKGPKYVSFICLSCVSCGREVGSVGAASLPRLIYFLTLLGMTLSTDRPGEQLSLVGNAFTALLEQLARQRLDEQQALGLRQLVTTWQQLPAGYPAAANVSRGVLTNLLRAT